MTRSPVDIIAAAVHDNDGAYAPPYWDDCDQGMQEWYRKMAHAALAALAGEGWELYRPGEWNEPPNRRGGTDCGGVSTPPSERRNEVITEYRRRAFDRRNRLHWPIRLRLLLIIPGSWKWNRWVRNATARLEGFADYEAETTETPR